MNIFGININIKLGYWKLILICLMCIFILGFFIWITSSYYIYKWLKMSIDKDYYYFNEYNNDCSEILNTYGDYNIKRIYLVRQPITKFAKVLLNLITFYKFEREMKKYIATTNNSVFFPQHTSIIAEVELPDKTRKKILIEKNNCLKLALDFRISSKQDMKKISIKKRYTINKLLDKTKNRIGSDIFFNWSICRNNCQALTKEILITLERFSDTNKKFIYQNDFAKQIKFSDFSLHIMNSIINICNTLENLIGRALYF